MADSFVDDVAVHSNQWREHLVHLIRFLQEVKNAGISLNLKNAAGRRAKLNFAAKFWALDGVMRTQKR